jgi:hypothetical protein
MSGMSDEAMNDGAAGMAGPSVPPGVSGGPDRGWVVALVCVVLPAALLTAIVAVPAALPSRAGLVSASEFAMIIAVIGTGLIRLGWVGARYRTPPGPAGEPGWWRRPTPGEGVGLIRGGLFIMAFGAALVIQAAVGNHANGGSRSAFGWAVTVAGVVGGPALLAAFADYALRHYAGLGLPDDGFPRSSLGLRAGERAAWTGRARARWPLATWWLAVLLGMGVLDRDLITQLIFVGVVVAIALLGFTSVRVTVAARGVTVGYGVLGLRLTRIALRRIAFAEAVEREKSILPYAGSLLAFGDVSVVLRSGPALRLTLRDGKTFLVTVDDAATGAALLNDLIAGAT